MASSIRRLTSPTHLARSSGSQVSRSYMALSSASSSGLMFGENLGKDSLGLYRGHLRAVKHLPLLSKHLNGGFHFLAQAPVREVGLLGGPLQEPAKGQALIQNLFVGLERLGSGSSRRRVSSQAVIWGIKLAHSPTMSRVLSSSRLCNRPRTEGISAAISIPLACHNLARVTTFKA